MAMSGTVPLLIGSMVFVFALGTVCIKKDRCSCTYDDGRGTVDLRHLGSKDPNNPLIRDVVYAADNYAYSFNPCYPFTEGTCIDASGCKSDPVNKLYYNIGDARKVTYSFDGTNLIGIYISDDSASLSLVTFRCDEQADPPRYQILGETANATYSFVITSKYACPVKQDSENRTVEFPPVPDILVNDKCNGDCVSLTGSGADVKSTMAVLYIGISVCLAWINLRAYM